MSVHVNTARPPTERELEVFWAVFRHGTHKEAAPALGLAPQSIKNHLTALYARLGVERFPEAAYVLTRRREEQLMDSVNALLERAAVEGRQATLTDQASDDLARYGHRPEPPTMRCQQCGGRLRLVWDPADLGGVFVIHWADDGRPGAFEWTSEPYGSSR